MCWCSIWHRFPSLHRLLLSSWVLIIFPFLMKLALNGLLCQLWLMTVTATANFFPIFIHVYDSAEIFLRMIASLVNFPYCMYALYHFWIISRPDCSHVVCFWKLSEFIQDKYWSQIWSYFSSESESFWEVPAALLVSFPLERILGLFWFLGFSKRKIWETLICVHLHIY